MGCHCPNRPYPERRCGEVRAIHGPQAGADRQGGHPGHHCGRPAPQRGGHGPPAGCGAPDVPLPGASVAEPGCMGTATGQCAWRCNNHASLCVKRAHGLVSTVVQCYEVRSAVSNVVLFLCNFHFFVDIYTHAPHGHHFQPFFFVIQNALHMSPLPCSLLPYVHFNVMLLFLQFRSRKLSCYFFNF